jgi:hypothetical protein
MSRKGRSVFDKGDFSEKDSGKSGPGADIVNRWDKHFRPDLDDPKLGYKSRALVRRDRRPQPANLSNARFQKETLAPPDEQPRLLAAARAGDRRAADKIVRAHLGWVQSEAKMRWAALNPPKNSYDENALTLDDFVAAGLAALVRSIKAWTPGANNGFNAFYRKRVRGAISDAARDWRTAGIKCETRLQRLIRSHPDWRPDWIQQLYKDAYPGSNLPSLEKIAAEQDVTYALFQPERYDEASAFTDAGDHDKDGEYLGGENVFNGSVRGYQGGAVSEWSRSQATSSLHPARKLEHPSLWVRTKKKSGSTWADHTISGRDSRVVAEIGKIGRRAYAQRLVDAQGIDPKTRYYPTSEYRPVPRPSPFDVAVSNAIGATDIPAHNDNFFKKAA